MSFLKRRDGARWASIFADDLRRGCTELFEVVGQPGDDALSLPISIPIDGRGVVLLRPEGPLDAPRVPATMYLTRPTHDTFGLRLERRDGGLLVIPGLQDPSRAAIGIDAPLAAISFTVTRRGLDIVGWGRDGQPVAVRFDEDTACALANALFITLRMKLIKAQRGGT